MNAKLGLTILVLVFLVSPVEARTTVAGEVSAQKLEATGSATFEAGLFGLTRFDPTQANTGQSLPDARMDLEAQRLRVDTYESDPRVTTGLAFVAPPPGEPNSTSYENVRLETLAPEAGYQIYVVAANANLPRINAVSDCESFEPTDRDVLEVEWKISRPAVAPDVNVSQGMHWVECGTGQAVIRGDFVVVLWQVDADLYTQDAVIALRSGYDESNTAPHPASSALFPTVSHARQQYLYVEGGALRIPNMDGSPHWAYLDAPRLDVTGIIQFNQAAGNLQFGPDVESIQATSLRLQGSLSVEATAAGYDPFQTAIQGHLTGVEADGQALALAATAVETVDSFPWAWLGLGLAATAVTVPLALRPARRLVATYLHDRRQDRTADLQVRCEDLVAVRRFEEARPLSAALLDLDPFDPDLQYLRATVLGNLGRLGDDAACREALEHHAEAAKKSRERLSDPVFVAENALQAALTGAAWHARAPEPEKDRLHDLVLNWMAEAVQNEPCLEADLGLHAELQPFLPTFVALMALKDSRAPDWLLP